MEFEYIGHLKYSKFDLEEEKEKAVMDAARKPINSITKNDVDNDDKKLRG